MKCSLKEFNQYRQWIRKLKLDELNRERRQDEKKIVEARKERLERIALERDPELLEILKRRYYYLFIKTILIHADLNNND